MYHLGMSSSFTFRLVDFLITSLAFKHRPPLLPFGPAIGHIKDTVFFFRAPSSLHGSRLVVLTQGQEVELFQHAKNVKHSGWEVLRA